MATLTVSQVNTRYVEAEYLKTGGQGTVERARDTQRGDWVALKSFPREHVTGAAEAEILSLLRLQHHPHIVQLREVFLTESHLVIVLEYAASGDLRSALPPWGVSEEVARWLFAQVLFALDYCHTMGIAVRDIKLDNVLCFGADGFVKLADFGYSVGPGCGAEDTAGCKGAVGTPSHMAPEVLARIEGGPCYDAKKADVWSAGVLLCELLCGCNPFTHAEDLHTSSSTGMLKRIQRADLNALPLEAFSWNCGDLIRSMLTLDPSARPSVRELLLHPWILCDPRLKPASMLVLNDSLASGSRANPPSPELVDSLRTLVRDAAIIPKTPNSKDSLNTAFPSQAGKTDTFARDLEGSRAFKQARREY